MNLLGKYSKALREQVKRELKLMTEVMFEEALKRSKESKRAGVKKAVKNKNCIK